MKIYKKTILMIIFIIFLFGLIGKNDYTKENVIMKTSADPEIKVVATTTILRDFTQTIIGNKGTVSVIIEGGMCPGHYDASPTDIIIVESADIVFCHGFELGTFLPELLGENINVAYSMAGNGSLGMTQWGSPLNAPLFIDVICNHLNDTYPQLADIFNQNSATFKQAIAEKKASIETLNTNNYNFSNTKAYIMVHQKAFLTWLGFNITGNWTSDDNSMSISEFESIVSKSEQTNTELIVMNYQSGTVMGQEAADELGILSIPLINFPGVYGANTYLEQLDFNIAMLNWVLNDGPDPRLSANIIGINLLIPLIVFILVGVIIIIHKKNLLNR